MYWMLGNGNILKLGINWWYRRYEMDKKKMDSFQFKAIK